MNKKIAQGLLEELEDANLGRIIRVSQVTALLWFDWFTEDRDWSNRSIEASHRSHEADEEYRSLQQHYAEKLKKFLSTKA